MKKKIKKLINAIANSENAEEFIKFFNEEDFDVEDFDWVESVWGDHFQNTSENFFYFWTVDGLTKGIMSSIKEAIAKVDWKMTTSDEVDDRINEDTFYYMYDIDAIAADILIGGYKLGFISDYDILSYINETVGITLIIDTALNKKNTR